MRTSALVLSFVLLSVPVPAQDDRPVPDATWTPLFDGRSFSGWDVPYPAQWKVEDGAIHVVVPEEVTWPPAKLHGAYAGMNYIRTSRNMPSHHIALEVKGLKGKLGIGHWGTMKKSITDSFFYGQSEEWVEVVMTWHAGTVLLFKGMDRYDHSAEAKQGENSGPIVLFLMPGSEVWLRNIRVKTISGGAPPKKDPPKRDDPPPSGLFAGGLEAWPHEGDWDLSGGTLSGRATREAIWIRRDEATGDGKLTFEYRAEGPGSVLTVLVDVADGGRRSTKIPLPARGRGWSIVEIELSGDRIALSIGGRVVDTARRASPGGGIGFAVARGGSVEIRKLEFE